MKDDRYAEVKKKIIEVAKKENAKLVVAIGSSTRNTDAADEYSDLDVIIVTNNADDWLYGELPNNLGNVKISFVESTLGGGRERRVLLENYLDVDMIVLTETQFDRALSEGILSWVMNRGYQVLFDSGNYENQLRTCIDKTITSPDISEKEFLNLVNDFYFHVIWATKKLYRGELWSAKMCIDAYLKNHLRKMIECYSYEKKHCDVWHDGRFLDKWADEEIKEKLKGCFARYDAEDMKQALAKTEKLFAELARKAAYMKGYTYPSAAEKYAEQFLNDNELGNFRKGILSSGTL